MIQVNLMPEKLDLNIPNEPLVLIKALLDVMTVIAFIALLLVVIYAKNRYPVIERRRIFWPMIGFCVLGIISMTMDAIDEFVWFTPKEFYDMLWKPSRLMMFLLAIFLLVVAFYYFYQFSERLFGEEAGQ